MERLDQSDLITRMNRIRKEIAGLVVEDLELIAHMVRLEVKEARLQNRYSKAFTPAQRERAAGGTWTK